MWSYLRGIATDDFHGAWAALLGAADPGSQPSTIGWLKATWLDAHHVWAQRDLSDTRQAYLWADAIYRNIRPDGRLCLLVVIGVTAHSHNKELLAVEDGYRKSEVSGQELLSGLCSPGLKVLPQLAAGNGAMRFWNALAKVFPDIRHQRCLVHKTANVLASLPQSVRSQR